MILNNQFSPLERYKKRGKPHHLKHQYSYSLWFAIPKEMGSVRELKGAISTLSKSIIDNVDILFPILKQHPYIKETAGFIAFRDSLVEFIKNSFDAKATHISINIVFNRNKTQCVFVIKDNGVLKIPTDKIGVYDVKQALLTKSQKQDANGLCLGGHQLGLAMAAHFVEKYSQAGWLTLSQCRNGGAAITIYSSTEPSLRQNLQYAGENYAHTIISDVYAPLLSEMTPDDPLYQATVKERENLLIKFHSTQCVMTKHEQPLPKALALGESSSLLQRRLKRVSADISPSSLSIFAQKVEMPELVQETTDKQPVP